MAVAGRRVANVGLACGFRHQCTGTKQKHICLFPHFGGHPM
ncbi:hypothetical protein I603_0699 [Erythrobacter dokdonensis DSW-74]|uniref:Uncharacterized protein n=1 Tax=Erythrobacter dokdonensis DSW-74 TaxID=1300349 RepID=A0A1A7BJ33_9SPHN|nr:hypothetical protein I603_0699 [Erythrobacter dokdonensis DSW-74]